MFCDERITAVYSGQTKFNDDNSYLDCYYDMTLHVLGTCRTILETENYYLSLQSDGVFAIRKTGSIDSIARQDELIEPCAQTNEDDYPWVDYESTLFVGERLLSVSEISNGWMLQFDDFSLNLIPYSDKDSFPETRSNPYCRVLGTERLITRKCTCGGTGQLIFDPRGDYFVRCPVCFAGTDSYQNAHEAIEDWNANSGVLFAGEYPDAWFAKESNAPITRIHIGLSNRSTKQEDLRFESIIVCFAVSDGISKYKISSRYAGNGEYGFCYENVGNFNPDYWPNVLSATESMPIRFGGETKSQDDKPSLAFFLGQDPLYITAHPSWLQISPIKLIKNKC